VDFDPRLISYTHLLDIFWKSHEPTRQSMSRQYLKAVFYHNEQQGELAMASRKAIEKETGSTVRTEVLPIRSFTMAEEYHQKFTLKRQSTLRDEMAHIYPLNHDFVNSTAVARLNGYAGGHGTKGQLSKEIGRLGLSPEGKRVLTNIVRE